MYTDSKQQTEKSDKFSSYFDRANTFLNAFFRRGTLAVMEVCGIILLIRSFIVGSFNFEAGVLGSMLLVIGSIIEYLIWRATISLTQLRVSNEEMRRQLDRAYKDRPRGVGMIVPPE